MERIYRWILVGVLVVLLGWGIWYVVTEYGKQSTYDNGVLVYGKMEEIDGSGNGIY